VKDSRKRSGHALELAERPIRDVPSRHVEVSQPRVVSRGRIRQIQLAHHEHFAASWSPRVPAGADLRALYISEIRYAKSGEVNIAYEIRGDGPFDLVFVPGWWSHLESARASDEAGWFFDRLASFCRLIRFDKRGTGMSDRVSGPATLEERMDDVRAVMEAADTSRG